MGTKTIEKKVVKRIEDVEVTKLIVCDFCGAEVEANKLGDTPMRNNWIRTICDVASDGEWIEQDWKGTYSNWMHTCPKCWPELKDFIESKRKK